MSRYVAFFSSMNVGGNRLAMADLRYALEREEFENVETVIASGNVLFDHAERPTQGLAEKLQYVVRDHFDFDSVATVRSKGEVEALIAGNPFARDGNPQNVHAHILERDLDPAAFANMVAFYGGRGPERIAPGDGALYIDYVEGVGRSKLTAHFIEKRLGCRGTARNMRSLARILEKMD